MTEHGVRSKYVSGCRCSECKAANTAYEVNRRHINHPLKPVSHIRDMTDIETAWLAGLLEGEGSFILHKAGSRIRVIVSIEMTDEDVLERVRDIVGLGNVNLCSRRQEHWKDPYKWAVASKVAALELMRVVYPYMGSRRQARIRECLTACDYSVSGQHMTLPTL